MARPSRLSTLSITELNREIRRRQRRVATLERRRGRIARKLAALDAQIAASGGTVGRGGTGRGAATRSQNKESLADALATLLKGKRLSVTDAADAVQKAGYHSSSPNFRTMVNIQLLNKKRFKRLGRGVYTTA